MSSASKRSAKTKTGRAKSAAKRPRSAGSSNTSSTAERAIPRWVVILLLALIICAAEAIRLRLLDLPLERDEGEYAYAGQLMLQGIPPYKLAYNMKFPGVYAAYALIMWIFGQTSIGIHLGLLIVNVASIVTVFLIARRLTG